MKATDPKKEFIKLRAAGQSYSQIAEKLHVSKSTCGKWAKELKDQIDELKRGELNELIESYGMAKEARIKRLGDMLARIDNTLKEIDLAEIEPAKLLEIRLKYAEALKAEYTGTKPAITLDNVDAKSILAALGDLLNRARAGEITTEQAKKESLILSQLLKAYDMVEIKAKVDELEAIIRGREND